MNQTSSHRILVAGSLAFDHCYDYKGSFLDGIDVTKLVDLSVSFSVERHRVNRGGAGANVAWDLALLEQDATLLSAAGSDAKDYIDQMRDRKVGTGGISIGASEITAHAVIVTDDAKRQITFFDPGIEEKADWLENIDAAGKVTFAILTPWRPSFMLPIFRWCCAQEIPFLFDPGQHILDFSRDELLEIIPKSHGVIVNAYEWHLLLTKLAMEKQELANMIPFAIITRGEEGFEIIEKNDSRHFPACTHDNTFNPTGAGDAFRAGLLTGITKGWPLETGCQLGAGLASVVVEFEEAQLSSIDLSDIRARVMKAYGTTIPELN